MIYIYLICVILERFPPKIALLPTDGASYICLFHYALLCLLFTLSCFIAGLFFREFFTTAFPSISITSLVVSPIAFTKQTSNPFSASYLSPLSGLALNTLPPTLSTVSPSCTKTRPNSRTISASSPSLASSGILTLLPFPVISKNLSNIFLPPSLTPTLLHFIAFVKCFFRIFPPTFDPLFYFFSCVRDYPRGAVSPVANPLTPDFLGIYARTMLCFYNYALRKKCTVFP